LFVPRVTDILEQGVLGGGKEAHISLSTWLPLFSSRRFDGDKKRQRQFGAYFHQTVSARHAGRGFKGELRKRLSNWNWKVLFWASVVSCTFFPETDLWI